MPQKQVSILSFPPKAPTVAALVTPKDETRSPDLVISPCNVPLFRRAIKMLDLHEFGARMEVTAQGMDMSGADPWGNLFQLHLEPAFFASRYQPWRAPQAFCIIPAPTRFEDFPT